MNKPSLLIVSGSHFRCHDNSSMYLSPYVHNHNYIRLSMHTGSIIHCNSTVMNNLIGWIAPLRPMLLLKNMHPILQSHRCWQRSSMNNMDFPTYVQKQKPKCWKSEEKKNDYQKREYKSRFDDDRFCHAKWNHKHSTANL